MPYEDIVDTASIRDTLPAEAHQHTDLGPGEPQAIFSNARQAVDVFENSILQMLNRWIPDEQTGRYYPVEPFQETVSGWEGIPLVFAQKHPDLDLFETDQAAALAQVNGVIAGYTRNPRVVLEGRPRLMAALEVVNEDVVALYHAGQLSLSTAFYAQVRDRKIVGGIRPNHVLLFKETGTVQPNDYGALVSNTQETGDQMAEEELENAGRTLSAENDRALAEVEAHAVGLVAMLKAILMKMRGSPEEPVEPSGETPAENVAAPPDPLPDPPADPAPTVAPAAGEPTTNQDSDHEVTDMENDKIKELTNTVGKMKESLAEKDALLNQKDQEIQSTTEELANVQKTVEDLTAKNKEMTEELANARAELEAFRQKEADAKFAAFLNLLPAGAKATDEQKAELRKAWDEDPHGLLMQVNTLVSETPASEEVGSEHVPQKNTQTSKDGWTIGGFNSETATWE